MTPSTHSLAPRANDVAPASDLGAFEIVRRLPVTTWSLRPNPSLPAIGSSTEESSALLAVGRVAGWLRATSWSTQVQPRLALRYSLDPADPSPRTTSAWLGTATDVQGSAAIVPPPPSWLPSIIRGWSAGVAQPGELPAEISALRKASWTIWLHAMTQPYGNASDSVAHARAARMLADGCELPAPMLAGRAHTAVAANALSRAIADATTIAKFEKWHRAWSSELSREAQRLLAMLEHISGERERLLASAGGMRAPKNCVELALSLIASPQITVAQAAQRMDVTFRAAQAIVEKFVAEKFLREVTGRKRDRVYQCDALSDEALGIPR